MLSSSCSRSEYLEKEFSTSRGGLSEVFRRVVTFLDMIVAAVMDKTKRGLHFFNFYNAREAVVKFSYFTWCDRQDLSVNSNKQM